MPREYHWNLNEYYQGLKDPEISKDKKWIEKEALLLSKKYKNKIVSGKLSVLEFKKVLQKYESILKKSDELYIFYHLWSDLKTGDRVRSGALQEFKEFFVRIHQALLFVELEMKKWNSKIFYKYSNHKELTDYKYLLIRLHESAKYTLPASEEEIILEKRLISKSAWQRLFEERISGLEFDWQGQKVGLEEIVSIFKQDPSHQKRKQAGHEFSIVLKSETGLISFIYNQIILDKFQDDGRRGFKNPEDSRIFADENKNKEIEILEKTVSQNFKLVHRHYRLKKDFIGRGSLDQYDRYSPWLKVKQKKIDIETAKKEALEIFGDFDKDFSEKANLFFKNGWLDSPSYLGKKTGAYCMPGTSDKNPRLLLNFTGTGKDVSTLVHEMGHGIHALFSQKQNYLNFDHTIPMAEIASTFAEQVLFEKKLAKLNTDREKLALISSKTEEIFATVFRQICFFKFEKEVHRLRRDRELQPAELDLLWQKNLQKMFGNSLKLDTDHTSWWSYVSHFFASPFYVYAYAFGELISLSLYAEYKKCSQESERNNFIKKYKELLSSGGSDSPYNLLKKMNIDIRSEKFWQGGLDIIGELIKEEEKLVKKIKK
jgi:oligoendopeptidase F